MKARKVFFSKKGKGWFEAEIPVELTNASYEELLNWAARQRKRYSLKSFLVSENTRPYPICRESA